jgi:hypothetical protein
MHVLYSRVAASGGSAQQQLQHLSIHDAHVIVQVIDRGVHEVQVVRAPTL